MGLVTPSEIGSSAGEVLVATSGSSMFNMDYVFCWK